MSRERVVSRLNDWNERGFIQLETKNVHQIYLVLKPLPSSGQDRQALSDKVYPELEVREQQDLARMMKSRILLSGSSVPRSLWQSISEMNCRTKRKNVATALGARHINLWSSRSHRKSLGTAKPSSRYLKQCLSAMIPDTLLALHSVLEAHGPRRRSCRGILCSARGKIAVHSKRVKKSS